MLTSTPDHALRVACYYRKSPAEMREAEESIDRQREECRRHAEHRGWTIVSEFQDVAKSGSRNRELRTGLDDLLNLAESGEIHAVLCFDTSRLSRQDILGASPDFVRLREAKVHVETVKEGSIKWDPMGLLATFMHTTSNHDYAVKVGLSSVSGRERMIREGFWPHGAVPFGFDRLYVSPDGTEQRRVKRTNPGEKARGWRLKLAIDEDEAAIVREVFTAFVTRDTSMRQIGRDLTDRGVATPRGGRGGWTKNHIATLLENPVYCGTITIGFNRYTNQAKRVRDRLTDGAKQEQHDGAVPAIVSPDLFEQVKTKLAEKRKRGRRPHAGRGSVLSGILYCGHCGYAMEKKSRRKADGTRYTYFTCSSAQKRPACDCKQWRILEDEGLRIATRELAEAVDFEIVKLVQAKPPEDRDPRELERLEEKAGELEGQVKRMTDNLALADSDIFPMLQGRLKEKKAELGRTDIQRSAIADWWS